MNLNSKTYCNTYLIQVLNMARDRGDGLLAKLHNAFAFGGGGSGLSKQAQEILDQLWSWEYMGAAEYEFGACQQALQAISEYRKQGVLVAKQIRVTGKEAVKLSERSTWYSEGKKEVASAVWVIASKHHLDDISMTLDSLLNRTDIPWKNDPSRMFPVRLKTHIHLWDALFSPDGYWRDDHRTMVGGLELDNGWFYFNDRSVFERTCQLFQIDAPADTLPVYVPPRALMSTDTVDRIIQKTLHEDRDATGVHTVTTLTNKVYELTYKHGDVVSEEHKPLFEQVERRLAVLTRKKVVKRDRKTKRYDLVNRF